MMTNSLLPKEFSSVIKLNKAKHIKTSPYHPTSNRATARFVETLKEAMKAKLSVSLSTKFQVSYRTTLHSTANIITVSNVQYKPDQRIMSTKLFTILSNTY